MQITIIDDGLVYTLCLGEEQSPSVSSGSAGLCTSVTYWIEIPLFYLFSLWLCLTYFHLLFRFSFFICFTTNSLLSEHYVLPSLIDGKMFPPLLHLSLSSMSFLVSPCLCVKQNSWLIWRLTSFLPGTKSRYQRQKFCGCMHLHGMSDKSLRLLKKDTLPEKEIKNHLSRIY